ncbi:helix-turn-helix domain-containing protein [Streptomyces sp. NPDC051555]|uniref:helix-turn-helix domain-containing protein n=1 Tax=Streptomyces sp. NPDC051555 TaxID=3365657 RepID=UPI00379C92D0
MAVRRRGVRGFDGAVLRAARERRSMSVDDLERATGTRASLIDAYEDGRRTPEWKTLDVFATALSSTVGELRPGHATTMEDLRCGAGQSQASAAAAAGLTRSGYAMLENGHTRTLRLEVAQQLAATWEVQEEEVLQAHAAVVQAAGTPAPVLEGAVLDGIAAHFGVDSEALLDLARSIQNQNERRTS